MLWMHRNPAMHVNGTTTDSANGWALTVFSETLTGGTGCLNWARPGLWGFRVGDCPVLPGHHGGNCICFSR